MLWQSIHTLSQRSQNFLHGNICEKCWHYQHDLVVWTWLILLPRQKNSELPHNRSVPHLLIRSSTKTTSWVVSTHSCKRRIQHMKRKGRASAQSTNLSPTFHGTLAGKGCLHLHSSLMNTACSFLWDSLSLRYGWALHNSPSHCSCGQPFSVEHALTCKTVGFPAVRYNDITATLLTWVWKLTPTYNRCPESPCCITQQSLKTVLNSTSQCTNSGEEDLKSHLLM